jgi:uncharacterized protein YgfB (UPF0149 family)
MMTLIEKIKTLYPELQDTDFMFKIKLQNDGNERGDYIAEWNHPTLARPTEEQLA